MTTIKTIFECAYNGFIIIAELKDGALTEKFLIINVANGLIEGPFGTGTAEDAIAVIKGRPFPSRIEALPGAVLSKHAYNGFFIVAELDAMKNPTGWFLVFTDSGVYKQPPHPSAAAAKQWIEDELEKEIVDEKSLEVGIDAVDMDPPKKSPKP